MNKKFLLSSLLLIVAALAHAQIKKGSVLLGGQISYIDSKTTYDLNIPDTKNRNGLFSASVGKATKDNSVWGVNLSFSASNQSYFNGAQYATSKFARYGGGIFYRKYQNLSRDFYLFGELGVNYYSSNQKIRDTSGNLLSDIRGNSIALMLTPGVAYSLGKKLQVEVTIPGFATAEYLKTKDKSKPLTSAQQQFSFNTNFNLTSLSYLGVGLRLLL